ncbi:hypothetical protein BCR37DRAFT_342477 [Protomyces lactucae-debilis]|uniref:Large ribosomal subunit protein mL46 n=1 Tax=Protomyces lactucae-debilis TaxID=2754530 RepID=A0A1Y2FUU0_PROLT|nr:uncharacterized protein BCR37DRAFT_342477 [Protomyces lactucae-debilis]ORY87771.1 hypothetical protein BCR37DRAFT_342477 [Protomyces lactucae-debilis]
MKPIRQRSKKSALFRTSAGLLVSRPPITTGPLSGFESAFYDYQRTLKARLASPFPEDFYFPKGSVALKRWQEALAEKNESSKGSAGLTPRPADPELEIGRPTERKSLNRLSNSTLYLLLKKRRAMHAWQFPQGPIGADESLQDAATRLLSKQAGQDMDVWTVSRIPVGVMSYQFESPIVGFSGAKVYFTKHRILAGQVRLDSEFEDFAWLSVQEIKQTVDSVYWKSIAPLLGAI